MSTDAPSGASPQLERVFEKGSLGILVTALLISLVFGAFLFPLPTFNTDLETFAPEGENSAAEERIMNSFGNERRPLFIHVTRDDGGNVLDIATLQEQERVFDSVIQWSESNGHFVVEAIAAPDMLERGMEERESNKSLEQITSWQELLEETLDEGESCIDGASNEELLNLASFARDSLVHSDLDFEDTTCAWLNSNRTSGDPTPSASSTLWVFYVRADLDDPTRQAMVNLLRMEFKVHESDSVLSFGLISNDVLSYDINEGTVDNLVWLISGALAVVVIILSLAFRSIRSVVFPLSALSMALVWTYGSLAAFQSSFSVLHVAVAPVVLGLGIDYSIHLQRTFERYRSEGHSTPVAWARSMNSLSVALTLTVVTTVAAFLSNVVSPLPPVRAFGLSLAFGVVSAFVTSTFVVGAMHVMMSSSSDSNHPRRSSEKLHSRAKEVVITQRRNQAFALIIVVLLTVGSVVAAAAELETEFDLSDFLSEDMEVMQVREDMFASYEATGWRPVYVLSEPLPGESHISDDEQFLDAITQMEGRFSLSPNVVIPRATGQGEPLVESVYGVLKDAISEDSNLGSRHGMRVIGGQLSADGYETGGVAAALFELTNNESQGDALSGASWSDRVAKVAVFSDADDCLNPCLLYMRAEVMIQASSNSESVVAVEGLQNAVEQSSGKYGVQATSFVSGDAVQINVVLQGLTSSQLESTAISLLVSTLVLLALTRRIGPAIIVITPVAIAATWVVGAMAILNLNWNVLTVMVTALTIGLGIDYSIHVWRRYDSLRGEYDPWEAIKEMHSTTGVALLLSAGTTICGFIILRLSPMPGIQDFGVVTSLTVLFSLILALGLMPILLAADSVRDNGS